MSVRDMIPWKKNRAVRVHRGSDGEIDPIVALQNRMNRLVEEFFHQDLGPSPLGGIFSRESGEFIPLLDLKETESEIRISLEIPGMEEKDIDVEVDEDFLTIRGEKKEEHESGEGDNYIHERCYGRFERTIPLPSSVVDHEKISANYSRGILKLVLPKSKEANKKRKKIQIRS